MKYIVFLITLLFISCGANDEHGHDHDTAGEHAHDENNALTQQATIWTGKTELFVEYPALVKGKISRFNAHFTILDGHRPVENGTVTVSLITGDKGIRNTAEEPSSPGIFTPALKPQYAGKSKLIFDLQTQEYSDRIVIEDVRVFESAQKAEEILSKVAEGQQEKISFLKEQAWKIEFQTTPVKRGVVYDVIPASGTWKALPESNLKVVAKTSGTVLFSGRKLTPGSKISQGSLLLKISSRNFTSGNLKAKITRAEADLKQTESAYKRKKELYESDIISGSEYEKAEKDYKIAKSEYETLISGYTEGAINVISPAQGFINSIEVDNGEYVEQGETILTISAGDPALLETQISQSYFTNINDIQNIWYQPESGRWSNIKESGGSILSVGKEVSKENPLLPVFVEINDAVMMPRGSMTEVQIAYGDGIENLVIPESALLEDFGTYSVIVQLSGENFETRVVQTGRRNGEYVEITDGLKEGEMVVSKGAYQVKMASAKGEASAHGHEH